MNDLEMAKKYLIEENLSLVIVKEGNIVYKDRERGIKPLLTAVLERAEEIKGGSLADKVIGKAAAILCLKGNIINVYGKIISEGACEILYKNNLNFEYENKVPYILNRTKTGVCPVENIAKNESDGNSLIKKIRDFLNM